MDFHKDLFDHIRNYTTLSEADEALLRNKLKYQSYARKKAILEPGKKCHSNYFVAKGCVRSYFINSKGEEQILQFAIENWWISDYESLFRGTASDLYIETIEDCELLILDNKDQEELFKAIPQLERYFRIVYQFAYNASIQRIKFLYQYSKEDLYKHFLNGFPGFLQRVPNYMMASYLGFTPEYLSEIRKKIIS